MLKGSLSDATEQGATAVAEPIDSGGDDRSDLRRWQPWPWWE
jgi:hypothetical protein